MEQFSMSNKNTLINRVWVTQGNASIVKNTTFYILGIIALSASAKFSIPFYPVPMTLQTMVVVIIGLTYGLPLGLSTMTTYLAMGIFGFPVLAYPFGGPTTGYLLGFIVATAVCGIGDNYLIMKKITHLIVVLAVANLAIYGLGLTWLGVIIGWDKPLLSLGLYPFILGDLLKMALVALSLPIAQKAFEKSSK